MEGHGEMQTSGVLQLPYYRFVNAAEKGLYFSAGKLSPANLLEAFGVSCNFIRTVANNVYS